MEQIEREFLNGEKTSEKKQYRGVDGEGEGGEGVEEGEDGIDVPVLKDHKEDNE